VSYNSVYLILKLIRSIVTYSPTLHETEYNWNDITKENDLRHVARVRDMRKMYKILVGKFKGKRQLERCKYKWENNIKMDLKKTGMKGESCIYLA
jgi:hypothetical protein